MIWQRIKNLWAWSAVKPFQVTDLGVAPFEKYWTTQKKAEIIKRKPIDPIDEIIQG